MPPNPDTAPSAIASPFASPSELLWQDLGWTPSAGQLAQFGALQEQLRLWNGRLNLTRLVEGEDFWISQLYDSLWPLVGRLNGPPSPLRCVDVGTGGGFPGLAVAIALPEARLTLIDSVGRKVEAVQAMAQALATYAPDEWRSLRSYPRSDQLSELEARYTARLPPEQVPRLFRRYCGGRPPSTLTQKP